MELIEQAYALPVFHLHVQAALNGLLPEFSLESALEPDRYFGKAVLFASRNAIAPESKGWLDSAVRDIPASGECLLAGNPICTILATGTTHNETMTSLIRRAELLKEEIYGDSDTDSCNGALH